MKRAPKKFFAACLTAVMVLSLSATAFAAETKTYTLNTYGDVDQTMTVTQVLADTVAGKIGNGPQAPTIQVGLNARITYAFESYGMNVYDEKDNRVWEQDGVLRVVSDQAVSSDEEGITKYAKGYTVEFTAPGTYKVAYISEGNTWNCPVTLQVVDGDAPPLTTPQPPENGTSAQTPASGDQEFPLTASAVTTSSKVLVNGSAVEFDAYNIGNHNYFKLRDVAQVVSGSDKQFEVTWDSEKNAINLISGQAYTAAGGELSKGDGAAKNATLSTSTIYKDGTVVLLTAYTIDGSNYFKLRDLGQAFDFNVSWDAASNAVTIDTTSHYTVD